MSNNAEDLSAVATDRQVVDLDQMIDNRRLGRFHVNLVFWPFLAMLADGFDLVVLGFAAPSIIAAWGIDRSAMGPALTASIIGMLVGSPLAGYLGDRYGRRPLIIGATFLLGLSTWATVMATGVAELVVLRFLAGLGLAGILPNVTALVSEYAPRRVRGTLLIILQTGVQVGAIVTALVSAALLSVYGWQILFQVGGLFPIVLSAILVFVLPESIKFLTLKVGRRTELLATARRLDPSLSLATSARFTFVSPKTESPPFPTVAFKFGMHLITPLLWGLVVVSLFTNLMFLSWVPTVLQDMGLSSAKAALLVSLYSFGGVTGSIILTILFNRYSFLVVVAFYAVAAPAMASIGQPFISAELLPWILFFTGVCVSGTQSALNSALGMLYPTPIRSNSAGWGIAVGRLGSAGGPLLGGWLMSQRVTAQSFFEVTSLPLIAGLAFAVALSFLCRRRFHSWRLDDVPAAARLV